MEVTARIFGNNGLLLGTDSTFVSGRSRRLMSSRMVTDTALFRDAAYHSPGDTPDHVSYEHLARVVSGLEEVIIELATP